MTLALVVLGSHLPGTLARRLAAAQACAAWLGPDLVVLCGRGEAERMAEQWADSAQLLALDRRSTCTRTNAIEAKAIMHDRGVTHALVVTSAWHAPRARHHLAHELGPGVELEFLASVDRRGWARHRVRERAQLREARGGRGPS